MSASPSEIFAGKDFGQTLESLKEYYDYILFGDHLSIIVPIQRLETYVDKVIPCFRRISTQSSDRSSIEFLKSLNEDDWRSP